MPISAKWRPYNASKIGIAKEKADVLTYLSFYLAWTESLHSPFQLSESPTRFPAEVKCKTKRGILQTVVCIWPLCHSAGWSKTDNKCPNSSSVAQLAVLKMAQWCLVFHFGFFFFFFFFFLCVRAREPERTGHPAFWEKPYSELRTPTCFMLSVHISLHSRCLHRVCVCVQEFHIGRKWLNWWSDPTHTHTHTHRNRWSESANNEIVCERERETERDSGWMR